MFAHVLLVVGSLLGAVGGADGAATGVATTAIEAPAMVPAGPAEPAPPPTFNEFIPEDRSIGECISALPKPGCGSEARGGWRQGLILLAILIGIAFIAWRIVRTARRARAADDSAAPV